MDKMRLGELGRDRMKLAEGLLNYVCPKVRRTNTPCFFRNNMKLIPSSNLYTKPYRPQSPSSPSAHSLRALRLNSEGNKFVIGDKNPYCSAPMNAWPR